MLEIINFLLKHFERYAKYIGLPETDVNYFIIIILIVGFFIIIIKQTYWLLNRIYLWRNQKLLNRDLHPYYSPIDVEQNTRYFIPVKYQNISPTEDEEPGRRYIASAKNKLIPLFLNKVFTRGANDNKYYLILADSGMGKTTLLINLYIAYKNSIKLPFSPSKFEIKLFPLGYPNIFNEIHKLNNKENTILLLDAFDEDIEALKDFKKRMNFLLDQVHKFRIIVLSCRTQFFPSRDEEPHETGFYTGGEQGEYKFQKLYLSVFDNKDVRNYLLKRFSLIFQLGKFIKAKKIVKKSPTLVVRPMLLSYIKDLVSSKSTFEFSFQVYQNLIEKWLERESKKPKIRETFGSEINFKNTLLKFSSILAVDLYKMRKKHGGYFLPRGEKFSVGILEISYFDQKDYSYYERVGKSKSLLNRDSHGNYKFAHKSILEYFLAIEFFENHVFYNNFKFDGMDAARRFSEEMLIEKIRHLEGGFSTQLDNNTIQPLSNLSMDILPLVKYLKINESSKIPLRGLKVFSSLVKLEIIDKDIFKKLYTLYTVIFAIEFYSNSDLSVLVLTLFREKWVRWFNSRKLKQKFPELVMRLKEIRQLDFSELFVMLETFNLLEQDVWKKWLELENQIEQKNTSYFQKKQKLSKNKYLGIGRIKKQIEEEEKKLAKLRSFDDNMDKFYSDDKEDVNELKSYEEKKEREEIRIRLRQQNYKEKYDEKSKILKYDHIRSNKKLLLQLENLEQIIENSLTSWTYSEELQLIENIDKDTDFWFSRINTQIKEIMHLNKTLKNCNIFY